MSTEWTDDAACRGGRVDPEAFYALGHGGTAKDWTAAREACASCPVATECLADAIDRRDAHGFRAGHTPDELARMMPRQTRQPVPIARRLREESA